jgi:coenzyme PQQ precursor peptide PqqA
MSAREWPNFEHISQACEITSHLLHSLLKQRRSWLMDWVTPDFDDISVACEINSYAVATL